MIILDGKLVSAIRREKLKFRVESFYKSYKVRPHLVVVIVGNNPASQIYVRNKIKACESVGMKSTKIELNDKTTQKELNEVIDRLNGDSGVDGILVQLPLPKGLSEMDVNSRLSPHKDADGFTFSSLGHLWAGHPIVSPCTPQGVLNLLDYYQIPLARKKAVVVGRSTIVGKPMAHLLTMADATVTICHSKTANLREYTSTADLVVVAAGQKHLLGKDDFKSGAVVVDVGMHGSGEGRGTVTGDVRLDELKDLVSAMTPVPGGVGPMTITTLLENTMSLAERLKARKDLN